MWCSMVKHYDAALVDVVQNLIDEVENESSKHAILAQWQKIIVILSDPKIAKTRKLKCTDVLPHPQNRGCHA